MVYPYGHPTLAKLTGLTNKICPVWEGLKETCHACSHGDSCFSQRVAGADGPGKQKESFNVSLANAH